MVLNWSGIEWCDRTLNPVVGCPHGCDFCYARKYGKRQRHRCILCYLFEPHPHLERLNGLKPTQKPMKIFMDSMWDWNSDGVKKEWLSRIIEKMEKCPQHTFQILSKRPDRYSRFSFPENVWLGTSISTNNDTSRIKDLLKANSGNLKFLSIEPIHERVNFRISRPIEWIIVGAETGNRKGRIIPEREWISEIIKNARLENISIFLKDNLNWPEKIQEFPKFRMEDTNEKLRNKR